MENREFINVENVDNHVESSLNILWLYPDVLNLHGGRGDLMALCRVGEWLGLSVELRRADSFEQPLDLDWADALWLSPGQIRCAGQVAAQLQKQRDEVDEFVAAGKMTVAIGSSGAVLARRTRRTDGSIIKGLGLIDMELTETGKVAGDDLWFETEGEEVMAIEISLLDAALGKQAAPLGRVIYGYGNDGQTGLEGARQGHNIFTNALGPVCVKNPRWAARLIAEAAQAKGLEIDPTLSAEQTVTEDRSFELIKKFIGHKQTKNK